MDDTLKKMLDLVDKYFTETPKEEIVKDMNTINDMCFSGPSAKEYFTNFGQQFNTAKTNMANQTYKVDGPLLSCLENCCTVQLADMGVDAHYGYPLR